MSLPKFICYYCMQEGWGDIQPQLLRQIEEVTFNRPEIMHHSSQILTSKVELPKLRMEEEDLPELKKHRTHLWILIHSSSEANIKKSRDYQQFKKMYEKSKYLAKRFCVHVNKFQQVYKELKEKLGLLIKCFVHSQVILSSQFWHTIKPLFLAYLVSQIVIKSRSEVSISQREEERTKCSELFQENEILKQRYSGFVEDFQETIELEKRLLNLALSTLKPNFFIINEYETVEASANLNSFHDILINTKAYLKESLDIKEKSKVQASLSAFKEFIYEEFRQQYKLQKKQKGLNLQGNKDNQRKILDNFFKFTEDAINRSYPFTNSEQQELFYSEIIIMYTRETVVYKSVNYLCKTVTSKEMFMKIAFFCKFLNLALKKKGRYDMQRSIRSGEYRDSVLYRGAMMSEIQWNSLKNMANTKGFIINLAFTSTSISQKVAMKFFSNNVRNNILIRIRISNLFQKYYDKDPYCKYLEYYIHNNSLGVSQQTHEEEVTFNCFNIFKVIGFVDQENEIRVLELQAFSHLQLIQKRQQGEQLTEDQQKILDVIVRIQKDKDYAEQLKEQGKTEQMISYLQKVVDSGVDLNVNQAQSYIQFMIEKNNKEQNLEKFILKIEQNSKLSIQQEMKMAIYKTIKEEDLETEIYLDSISEKLLKGSENNEQERYNWGQLMERSCLKHTIAVNKEKIGAYEECFEAIHQNLDVIHPLMQVSQFFDNIQTWNKFFDFVGRLNLSQTNAVNLLKTHKKFVQIYKEFLRKESEDYKPAIMHERILSFLQKAERQLFLSLFDRLNNTQARQLFYCEDQLRRNLQQYKHQFYERSKSKVRILIYNYELLIKSQRVELSKSQEKNEKKGSQFYMTLFDRYFQTNKTYFESMYIIYQKQKSAKYKYDKAMFFKEYCKFLSGLSCFYKMSENQKVKYRKNIEKVFLSARQLLMQIYQQHEQLASIQTIEDNTREERLFSERMNKINSICQSLNIATSQQNSILSEKELKDLAQSLKNSREESARRYSKKNSFLNQNLCYSSVLNMTMEVVQKTILSSNMKQKYELQFQKLASKIQCKTNSNIYLRQHTSNAFNDFLRATFEYYRGSYEAAMVFIGKSQETLNNKLKATQDRISKEKDEAKKEILEKKVQTIKQNNQVRIKICILKSKICINYKPNIHSLCIKNLRQQKDFIKEKLFQHNSCLPQLYYYQVYLRFMLNQIDIDTLNAAFRILLPRDRPSVKRELLKYYTLKYNLTSGTEKIETENVIEEIGRKCGIAVANLNAMKMDLIEEHQLYYFFKIQQCAEQNNFSFYKIIQNFFANRSQKEKLDKITQSQNIMLLFVLKVKPFWQIIEKIILTKFDTNILVSYRLFTAYFFYLQYLLSLNETESMSTAFANLRIVATKLAIIVHYSDQSRLKYGVQSDSNGGFDDKIKVILLHVYKYTSQHRAQVPPNSDILGQQFYKDEYSKFKTKYFSNASQLDE